MFFLTYEATWPWAAQIKALVTAEKMPPSLGSAHYMVLPQGEGLPQTRAAGSRASVSTAVIAQLRQQANGTIHTDNSS